MRQLVLEFVKAINDHDTNKIASLISEDHVFIDSQGNEVHGKDKMIKGWEGYFNLFPDYKIVISQLLDEQSLTVLLGFASASFLGNRGGNPDSYWRLPAAWKAVTEGGKINLWQVFADTKIPFEIINKFTK